MIAARPGIPLARGALRLAARTLQRPPRDLRTRMEIVAAERRRALQKGSSAA